MFSESLKRRDEGETKTKGRGRGGWMRMMQMRNVKLEQSNTRYFVLFENTCLIRRVSFGGWMGDIRLRDRIAIGWRSYCVWRRISVRRHDDYSVIKRLVGQDRGGIDVEFCVSRSGGCSRKRV